MATFLPIWYLTVRQTSSSPFLKWNACRIHESAKISFPLLCMGEAFVSFHFRNQHRYSLHFSSNTGCKWFCSEEKYEIYVFHVSYGFPFWKDFMGYFAVCTLWIQKIHSLWNVFLHNVRILHFFKGNFTDAWLLKVILVCDSCSGRHFFQYLFYSI